MKSFYIKAFFAGCFATHAIVNRDVASQFPITTAALAGILGISAVKAARGGSSLNDTMMQFQEPRREDTKWFRTKFMGMDY